MTTYSMQEVIAWLQDLQDDGYETITFEEVARILLDQRGSDERDEAERGCETGREITRPMREPPTAMYLVYICENCARPRREPLNGKANSDLPWTKIEYCQHCCARHVFLRDGLYPINPPGTTAQPSPVFVYLFRAQNGLYKIGISSDPAKRLASLAIGPVAIELVLSHPFENAKTVERDLHNHFSDKRIRGEWFALQPADVTYIQLRLGGGE